MRIAVLAHNLRVAGGLSVGKNLVSLLPTLSRDHQYLFIVPGRLGYPDHKDFDSVQMEYVNSHSLKERIIYDTLRLPSRIRAFRPDLVLGLGNFGMSHPPCKQAFLFHKSQLVYPGKQYSRETVIGRLKNQIIKQNVKRSLPSTQKVFCQTPVIQKRFSETFGYPLEQIKIIPNAISEYAKGEESDIVPEILQDKSHFNLFFLTKFYAHKNIEILIDLFRDYPDAMQDFRCILTVSNTQHVKAPAFFKNIQKYQLSKKIVCIGAVEQNQLSGYFRHADALFFPTLLESFSGTYLEAMHFGLPILTSDLDFAHYICDDAAFYFNPSDPADIVQKIVYFKNNPDFRRDLASKGKNRIRQFFMNWKQIATNLLRECETIV